MVDLKKTKMYQEWRKNAKKYIVGMLMETEGMNKTQATKTAEGRLMKAEKSNKVR